MNANAAYNAAVKALRAGDAPTAIAHLLWARAAKPRDTEVGELLNVARTSSASIAHQPALWGPSSTDLAGVMVLVTFVLSVAIARGVRKRLLAWGAAAWVVCFGSWLTRVATVPTYAVVARADVVTHAADDVVSLERFRTHVGDELIVEQQVGEWLKVRAPDGERAYVTVHDVVSVEADWQR